MIASTQPNHPLTGAGDPFANSPSPIEFATAKLKSSGLRITRPRIAIVKALSQHQKPVSIEELHADVGPENCDLVTVYRCIGAFEEIGLVRRAFFHNGTALYELNLGQPARYHVVCKATNRVDDLDPEASADLRRAIASVQERLLAKGYADIGHIVEFFGVAPSDSRPAALPAPPVR